MLDQLSMRLTAQCELIDKFGGLLRQFSEILPEKSLRVDDVAKMAGQRIGERQDVLVFASHVSYLLYTKYKILNNQ